MSEPSRPFPTHDRIEALVYRPAEGLNVEIKRWIDPASPSGTAKIVRAAFALRNRNGGELIVGFDDASLLAMDENLPADVRAAFHVDTVQGVISRFSSEPFPVGVTFVNRDGRDHPVINVPSGVRAPVAVSRDLDDAGVRLLRVGDVYFRTLAC